MSKVGKLLAISIGILVLGFTCSCKSSNRNQVCLDHKMTNPNQYLIFNQDPRISPEYPREPSDWMTTPREYETVDSNARYHLWRSRTKSRDYEGYSYHETGRAIRSK